MEDIKGNMTDTDRNETPNTPADPDDPVIIEIEDGDTPDAHRDGGNKDPKGEKEQEVEEEKESSKDSDDDSSNDEKEGNKKDKSSGKKKKKSAAALEIALKKAQSQMEEYADKYQRLLAEFENARNRSAREQSKMYDAGAKDILSKLLPVVDNFERGLSVLSDEEKEEPFAQGIIKIYQQLMTTLEQVGVKPMDPVGKEFDPNYHNAVMHEDNDEMGENLVAEEFQKGYMYKDDVLRHSMVKVVN